MNLKLNLVCALTLAVVAAGCSSDKEKIVFLSQAKIPASVLDGTAATAQLSKSDEQTIDAVVAGYLLAHPLPDAGKYSAVFLQTDDSLVDAMIKKYPDHTPPIKRSDHIDLRTNQTPLDRDTGKPVVILGVEVAEPAADGSVEATGRWYAGSTAVSSYTFTLKKTGDDWLIVSVK